MALVITLVKFEKKEKKSVFFIIGQRDLSGCFTENVYTRTMAGDGVQTRWQLSSVSFLVFGSFLFFPIDVAIY